MMLNKRICFFIQCYSVLLLESIILKCRNPFSQFVPINKLTNTNTKALANDDVNHLEYSVGKTNRLNRLFSICKYISPDSNSTRTLLNLIHYGDNWLEKRRRYTDNESNFTADINQLFKLDGYDKVSGCMASVYLKTSLLPEKYRNDSNLIEVTSDELNKNILNIESIEEKFTISINGLADSRGN